MRRATLVAVAGTTLLIVLMDWVPTPLIHLGVLLSATFAWLSFRRHPGWSAPRGGSRPPGSGRA